MKELIQNILDALNDGMETGRDDHGEEKDRVDTLHKRAEKLEASLAILGTLEEDMDSLLNEHQASVNQLKEAEENGEEESSVNAVLEGVHEILSHARTQLLAWNKELFLLLIELDESRKINLFDSLMQDLKRRTETGNIFFGLLANFSEIPEESKDKYKFILKNCLDKEPAMISVFFVNLGNKNAN